MESPTIDIEQVLLQFSLSSEIKGLCVDSDIMVVAGSDRIHRIDLATPTRVTTAVVPSKATVLRVWQHPSGEHLFVHTMGALYYLHSSYSDFKLLPKFKGLSILSVAFSRQSSSAESTGDFLVTTSDGSVYVAFVTPHNATQRDNKKDEKYVRLVYKLPQGHFTNIQFTAQDMSIVATSSSLGLYSWDCFGTSLSDLTALFKSGKPLILPGKEFILASNGQAFAALDVHSHGVISNDEEISLASEKCLASDISIKNVHDLIMTRHYLVFANDQVVAVNKLTPNSLESTLLEPFEERLPKGDTLVGITADYTRATYWLYSQTAIYELIFHNELALVWHNFFMMQRYDDALKSLKSLDLDPAQVYYRRNMVLIKQGYHLLQQGQFGLDENAIDADLQQLRTRGVKALARLTESFEKVCLMLMGTPSLLLTYLMAKFESVNKPPKNLIRLTVLLSWIVEILLRQVECEKSVDARARFDSFIKAHLQILDRQTVYQLGRDMNCFEPIIYFANLLGDYQYIVAHHIGGGDWKRAVDALLKMYYTSKDTEIFYSTATVLLANAPRLVTAAWLQIEDAEYEKFLPAILAYCSSDNTMPVDANCALEFMHAVILEKQARSRPFNDHYIALLAAYPVQDQTSHARVSRHLVRFLHHVYYDLVPLGVKSLQCYDFGFALRLCIEHAQYHAAILILVHETQQYKEALTLALEHDLVELAELVLQQFDTIDCNRQSLREIMLDHLQMEEELFQSRKQLWLKYAQYLIDRAIKGYDSPTTHAESIISIDHGNGIENGPDGNAIKSEPDENAIENGPDGNAIENGPDGNAIENGSDGNAIENSPGKNTSQYSDSIKTGLDAKALNGDGSAALPERENGAVSDQNRQTSISSKTRQDTTSIKSAESAGSVRDAIEQIRNSGKDQGNMGQDVGLKKLNEVLRYILRLSSAGHGSILGLKDLLPLLPQSITINHFKSEIVKSLNAYNDKINDLSLEMRGALAITTTLKHRLAHAPNDAHIFEAGKACMLCERLLLEVAFIYFPNCKHGFHKECLVKHYLGCHYQFQKLYRDYKALKPEDTSKVSELRTQIEATLIKECPLCNDANIASIDKPMVDQTADKGAIIEWDL